MSNPIAQRETVVSFLQGQRHPPPGAWTDNRLGQAQHYTGAIYLALSAISEALASAAVWVEQRRARKSFTGTGGAGDDEDYTPLGDHPLSEIVQFPNPHESLSSILGYLALQWGLTGNAPVWFVPGASHDRPVELYPLPEAVLQPVAGPTPDNPDGAWLVQPYYPTGWAWSYGTLTQRFARAVVLPGREVKKLRAPHPLIRNDGYSPLTACGVQFDILEAIDQSRHSAMLQGAQLGTIVSVAGLAPDQLEQAAQSFRQRNAGPHNARSVLFVSPPPGSAGDGFRVEQVGESPREMDYASSWEQATKFVLATFGVPPAIAGLQATTGYAEFYAAQIQFHYRISQLARRMADFFTLHLAGPWSRYPGEFRVKIEIPKPRNQDEYKQQMVNLAAQGAVSVNELRAAFDLGPVRYGDLPPAIYTQKLQADENPPAQPAAGGDTGRIPPPGPAEAPAADTPTGGAPPTPDNPEGEDSLPQQKARQVGEQWTDAQGRRWELRQVGNRKIPVHIAGHAESEKPAQERQLPGNGTAPTSRMGRVRQQVVERLSRTRGGRAALAVGRAAAHVVHAFEKRLLYVSHKVELWAVEAAKERGYNEEQAKKLKRSLYVADFLGGYVTGGIALAVAGPLAGKVTAVMPSASVLYLAYSTARDPRATWRAAKTLIRRQQAAAHKAMSDWRERLADLAAGAHDEDWFLALWCAALGHANGDPQQAVELLAAALNEEPQQKARQVGEEWETNGQWYRLEQVGNTKIPVRIPPPSGRPDRDQPKKPQAAAEPPPPQPQSAGSVIASSKVKPLDPENPHGWHVVNSKGVSHLYYDPENRTMTVRWKGGKGGGRDDRFVTYYDVSPELAAEIANAGSVGTAVIKKLRNDEARSWTANDARHLLDPAILDPRIAEVLKRAKGKKDKALTQELQALLVPENEWTYGYAQQAGAAILSLIPKDRKNRLQWGTEYGAAFESFFTVTIDHGWVHHGETGAADSSSGQKTYTTADGVPVVLGIDFKTSKGEDTSGSYRSTTGGLHQKVSFIDYDPGNPDHRANDTYAAHGVSPDHHRLLFHFAGVDVYGSGKKAYAFAYFRAKPGGGGYTQFRPSHDITYKGQTFRKGEPIPPNVLCETPPKTLQSWGFNPLKHCMPIRIQGLQRPEDFVKDPALMQKLHAKMEEFVKLIPYEDYCKEMGIALSASAEKDIIKASLMGADGHRVAGTTPTTQEQLLAAHAAKKHKEAERAKKQLKKHKEQLAEKDQQLTEKDRHIAEKDRQLAQLKALLQKHGIDPEAS